MDFNNLCAFKTATNDAIVGYQNKEDAKVKIGKIRRIHNITNLAPFSYLTVVLKKRDFTLKGTFQKCAIVAQCLRRLAPKVDR